MKLSFDEEHRHAMNELGETHFLSHFLSVFVVFPTGCLCDLQPNPRSVYPPSPPQAACRPSLSCCRRTASCTG